MDALSILILSVEGFVFIGLLVLVLLLTIKRYRKKKNESIDQSDN